MSRHAFVPRGGPSKVGNDRENLTSCRELLRPFGDAGTFILDAEDHGWIHTDDLYRVDVSGVRLVDWFGKIARGEPAGHVGP